MKNLVRKSLVTNILIVFILFNAISLLVFTFFVIQQDKQTARRNVESSLLELASEKANSISMIMKNVAYEAENTATWAEKYITDTDRGDTLSDEYYFNNLGTLMRKKSEKEPDCSAVFFPANQELTSDAIRVINLTEKLDARFQEVKQRQDTVRWIYISTEEGLLRCYPYFGMGVFMPNHQQKEDPFYVDANEQNNPERKTIWTKPYVDYLGTGWLISCSHPVYYKNSLFGVVSADIGISTLREKFLTDFNLGESGLIYLLSENGDIIFHPKYVTPVTKQGQLFLDNIFDKEETNESKRKALNIALSEEKGMTSYALADGSGSLRTLAFAPVKGMPWRLVLEIDRSEYTAIHRIERNNFLIFLLFLFAAILIFGFILLKKYSKPMNELVNQAKGIASGNFRETKHLEGYSEIETLSDAFCFMSEHVEEYTESLLEKNREIESIFNSISGILMIVTPDGEIRMMNKKGKRLLGLLGNYKRYCYDIFSNGEGICKGCKIREVITGKESAYARMAIDGEIYNNAYYPIINRNNEVEEIVVFSQRVTKSILMEKELQQAEKLAGIGQISSAIAHELKNPLTVIKGSMYLLDAYTRTEEECEVKEIIKTVSETVKEAEKVIYSLLDFSAREEDKDVLVDMTKIINQILLLNNRDCIRYGILIEKHFEPDPFLYYGKAEPLKNIFQNIIANAIKALNEGGKIKINGCVEGEGGNKKVRIRIEDDGIGIPSENLEKIFTPFFTTDQLESGTGLGLWITKMLVEKMGGKIEVESQVGIGTAFILYFPISEKGTNYELQHADSSS
ncbi:ATP-binding protein [Sinanaerobacter sp. ZZT-01]|uniref:ATP-binding protein n=1 Tax=Sinanaerobacter sp. ZZT-01 TaxID=3111540 RepID=UPI002D76659A|nr:ATP-binding protein [Sinanaerobacter sp. ZZT-01]WRR94739.1 ATP-binding protein [Sinanaerobacter sp. ZZT-01]